MRLPPGTAHMPVESALRLQSDANPQTAVAGESPLAALCLIARLHHIAADPAHLAHQLGWTESHRPGTEDLLLAAKHLGLKAKLSRTTPERLALAPLPALALLADESGQSRVVVLAQCDGKRVLFQDPSGAIQGGRPVIEPLNVFEASSSSLPVALHWPAPSPSSTSVGSSQASSSTAGCLARCWWSRCSFSCSRW